MTFWAAEVMPPFRWNTNESIVSSQLQRSHYTDYQGSGFVIVFDVIDLTAHTLLVYVWAKLKKNSPCEK